jgi:hypothetical protein
MKKITYLLIPILSFLISCDKNEDIPVEEPQTFPTRPADEDATKTSPDGININVLYNNGVPLVDKFSVRKKSTYFIDRNSNVIEYYYREIDGVFQWVWTKDILTTDIINKGDTIIVWYEPEDAERDEVTKLKDLQQKESVFDGRTLDVDLEHTYAKLTLDIKSDDNLSADKYKVSLLNKYTFAYGETHSLILEPQTIPKGSLIKLEIEGEVFTKTLTDTLALEANKELIVSLKMIPITRSLTVSSHLEWIKVNADLGQVLEIENFKAELPSNGEFAVNFQDLSKIHYYRYDKSLKLLIPQEPYLYWGNFKKNKDYKIYGSFTPDTEGIPEKDVLKTASLNIEWGKPLDFNVSIHANALLNFTLVNIGGYTTEQFEEYKKKATIELEGLYEPSGYKTQLGKDMIVKPKELTDDDRIILNFNDKKYGIKVKDINNSITGTKITKLIENKTYDIKLNLSQTALMNVKTEITDWMEINAVGNLGRVY